MPCRAGAVAAMARQIEIVTELERDGHEVAAKTAGTASAKSGPHFSKGVQAAVQRAQTIPSVTILHYNALNV